MAIVCTYCGSRKCQQKHYHKHKRMCRKIGDFLCESSPDSRAAGHGNPILPSGGSRACSKDDGTKERVNNIIGVRNDFKSLPIKGINPPWSHPMTSLMDPIDQRSFMSQEQYLVVHAAPTAYYVHRVFGGVYKLVNPTMYLLDREKTYELTAQMDDSTFNLEALGHSFAFHELDEMIITPVLRFVRNTRNELTWCLKGPSLSNKEYLVETRVPRARDRKFWDDPYAFLHLHADDFYGTWAWSHSREEESIGISSLKAVTRAMQFDPSEMRRPASHKFLKAVDFEAWNRNFVLFTDHRTSQLPEDWVQSSMGFYKPIRGKIANGYPVWEKHHTLTSELMESMSGPVKRSLEKFGVMLSHSSREKRFLYVSRESRGGAPLLALSKSVNIGDNTITSSDDILKAEYVPEVLDKIMSQFSYYAAEPESVFSSWKAFFQGSTVDLHVALTPEESFKERIRLTQNDIELLEHDVSTKTNGSSRKKKKNRKKKAANTTVTLSTDDINPKTKGIMDDSSLGTVENNGTESSSVAAKNQQKSKKKPKKKRKKDSLSPGKLLNDEISTGQHATVTSTHQQTNEIVENTISDLVSSETVTSKSLATAYLSKLASFVEAEFSIEEQQEMIEAEELSTEKVLEFLWSTDKACTEKHQPLWLSFEENVTAPILDAALKHEEALKWIQCNASRLVMGFLNKRREELSLLINAGVCISAESVAALFSSLPKGRGDEFNNKIAKMIAMKCNITLETQNDFKTVLKSISHTIGKGTKKEITELLKRASATKKITKQKSHNEQSATLKSPVPQVVSDATSSESKEVEGSIKNSSDRKIKYFFHASEKIEEALRWYSQLLDDLTKQVSIKQYNLVGGESNTDKDQVEGDFQSIIDKRLKTTLNSEEIVQALSLCDTEDALTSVERSIDLLQWDGMSCWNIDVTENAHKWFQKHKKKNRALCERVIRRLTLLSTGRWPYVLCKRLKSKSTTSNLYETKVDNASRIIWEVALSFSPRRSSSDQNFCEQVIRVWDIVLDHDNLSRAIEIVIERIEKSHLRGQECALYSEIDTKSEMIHSEDNVGKLKIPRVFPMQQQVISCTESGTITPAGKSRHFHPASDDPRQFTLLKFYELNAGAILIYF